LRPRGVRGLPSEVRDRRRLGGGEGQARHEEEENGHHCGEKIHWLINESTGVPVTAERMT
jgi:hypothetical protein